MKRQIKNTEPQTVYALQVIGYQGAKPETRFTFTATSEHDAELKAIGWSRYQGFVYQDDVTFRAANETEKEWETHNEWMRH